MTRFPVTMLITKDYLEKNYNVSGDVVKAKNAPIEAEVWYIYESFRHHVLLIREIDAVASGLLPTAPKEFQ